MDNLKFVRSFYKTSTFQTSFFALIALVYVIVAHAGDLKFWLWGKSEIIVAMITVLFLGLLFWSGFYKQLYFLEINKDKFIL